MNAREEAQQTVNNRERPAFGPTCDPEHLVYTITAALEKRDKEIEQLKSRITELEGALRPFADCARFWDEVTPNDRHIASGSVDGETCYSVTLGHARKAAEVLEKGKV